MAREESLILEPERPGRHPGEIEVVVGLAGRDGLQLIEEHGRQVKRGVDARMATEDRDHVPVIFRGVEAGPRKKGPPGERVAVGGLMHVPHQRETNGFRHRGGGANGRE